MSNHLVPSAKRTSVGILSTVTALLTLTAALHAQCGNEAVPGFPHLGPSGPVDALCYWDPDGQGPLDQQLFVGGRMDFVERTPCAGAALYNPIARTWSALPVGVFDQVHAATVNSTGLLIVAGSFGSGPTLQYRVASFDGNSLTVLGSSFDGPILTAATHGGNLIVGGSFTQNGGQPLASLAQWNGTSWSNVGGGVSSITGGATITALCTMTNGDLAVGGTFATAGSTTAANIAHWNGTSWQAFGSGLPAEVTAIATFSTGELFAAGLNQGAPSQWDGANWNTLTGLSPASGQSAPWVSALAVGPGFAGEELTMLGSFRVSFGGAGDFASWDPLFGWGFTIGGLEGMQTAPPTRMSLAVPASSSGQGTQVYAIAGPFVAVAGRGCSGAATFTPNAYVADPLGAGIDDAVTASASLPNGDLLIGGRFAQVDRSEAAALAISNAAADNWHAPTVGGYPVIWGQFAAADIRSIVKTPDGGFLIGGSFGLGTTPGTDIAYFDGSNWTGYGASPFSYGANAVLQHTDGTIYCGGNGVYRRDGSAWTLLSTVASGIGATCYTLAELANGDLVVGGDLQVIPGGARPGVMRWNGSSWQPLGAGLASVAPPGNLVVAASCVRDDGVLWVVGTASSVAFAANFDGTAWQLLPGPVNGNLQAITVLPDGDIVVGGEFDSIAGVAANSIARFDGTAWHAIGDGVKQLDGQPGKVLGLHFGIEGDLHIAGEFARHDGEVSINFTRLRSLCPSLTQSFAAGCSGSGGQNVLRREIGAWLGGTMRNVATGLPQNSLAIEVLGLAPTFAPLPTTGCTLWVRPDLLAVLLPVAGTVTTQAAIPDSPTLIGQVLYQQIVGVEVVGSTIAGFTGSNRLQHTIGVF